MENATRENADRCVCCGAVVPEGMLICKRCQLAEPTGPKPRERVFSRLRRHKKPKSTDSASTK